MKSPTKLIAIVSLLLLLISSIVLIYFNLFTEGDYKEEIIVPKLSKIQYITWYTSIPQISAERITNVFTSKTGIGVNIERNSTFIIKNKLLTEIKRGKIKADVITLADVGTFKEFKQDGHLMKYLSPYYKNYPKEYKDEGYWVAFAAFGICMAYNKNKINNPPEEWTDLLDERWRGRIGIEDINTAGSQYGQYYMLREKLGQKFWKKLLNVQKPQIYYKTEDLANALIDGKIDIAGEFSIHTVYNYKIKKGTPIEGIYPKEGIPLILNPIAIIKSTKVPKLAQTFFDFLISLDGQNLMQELNYKYSVSKNISSLEGIPKINDLNILQPKSFKEYAKRKNEYVQEFNSLLKGD